MTLRDPVGIRKIPLLFPLTECSGQCRRYASPYTVGESGSLLERNRLISETSYLIGNSSPLFPVLLFDIRNIRTCPVVYGLGFPS